VYDDAWTKAGADKIPPLITRGILIDVASEKGVTVLPEAYEITIEDLQGALSKQGTTLAQHGTKSWRLAMMRPISGLETAFCDVSSLPGLMGPSAQRGGGERSWLLRHFQSVRVDTRTD
jgi:hypothetical protein